MNEQPKQCKCALREGGQGAACSYCNPIFCMNLSPTQYEELETIAEVLEADGDEWNCAARIRNILTASRVPEYTGTVKAFLSLPDEEKAAWFILSGRRDSEKTKRIKELETTISELQEKLRKDFRILSKVAFDLDTGANRRHVLEFVRDRLAQGVSIHE